MMRTQAARHTDGRDFSGKPFTATRSFAAHLRERSRARFEQEERARARPRLGMIDRRQ
jgi:hypothetical protein